MTDYQQPEFYRFNEDSLRLVRQVLTRVKTADSILDLGAGCGIIGIELAKKLKPKVLTMVEAQGDFIPYIKSNLDLFLNPGLDARIVNQSFGEWKEDMRYDLIVANPPYFLPGHGEKNHDIRKETARCFILDGWPALLEKIFLSLKDDGRAFVVIKKDERIIRKIRESKFPLNLKLIPEEHLYFLELTGLDKN